MLTPKQVKEKYFPMMGINQVYDMIHKKGFPVMYHGKRAYIPAEKLEEWINKQIK